jgi:hypothetical protein
MGRYYDGDIEGKFMFGRQSSDDADFFGQSGTPEFINYYFKKEDISTVRERLLECLKILGNAKPKIDKFFKKNDSFNNQMFEEEFGWDVEKTNNNLEWYARFELGKKIYKHLKDNDYCSFQAEL